MAIAEHKGPTDPKGWKIPILLKKKKLKALAFQELLLFFRIFSCWNSHSAEMCRNSCLLDTRTSEKISKNGNSLGKD